MCACTSQPLNSMECGFISLQSSYVSFPTILPILRSSHLSITTYSGHSPSSDNHGLPLLGRAGVLLSRENDGFLRQRPSQHTTFGFQ